jgi:hypothetical protein
MQYATAHSANNTVIIQACELPPPIIATPTTLVEMVSIVKSRRMMILNAGAWSLIVDIAFFGQSGDIPSGLLLYRHYNWYARRRWSTMGSLAPSWK